VTWILRSGLPHKRKTLKNHEVKILINKMLRMKLKRKVSIKKGSKTKKITIKKIKTNFEYKQNEI